MPEIRDHRAFVWSSFAAWAVGALVMAWTWWQDRRVALVDDVGAGLAGLAFAIGFGIFALCAAIGVALGFVATRRAPSARAADVALGLNVITLGGALLSAALLFAR